MSIKELVWDIFKMIDDVVIDGSNESQTLLDMIETLVGKILAFVQGKIEA